MGMPSTRIATTSTPKATARAEAPTGRAAATAGRRAGTRRRRTGRRRGCPCRRTVRRRWASSRRPCSAAAAPRSRCRSPRSPNTTARLSSSGSRRVRRPRAVAARASTRATPDHERPVGDRGRVGEGEQAGQVGGGQVGEHRQRRERDASLRSPRAPLRRATTAPSHSTAWRTTKATATGATMSSRKRRRLVELGEVVGALRHPSPPRPPAGSKRRPSMEDGAIDADEVEDRRRDVDQGDDARRGGWRPTRAGRRARRRPEAGERQVDRRRPRGTDRRRGRRPCVGSTRAEDLAHERVGVTERGQPHRLLLRAAGQRAIAIRTREVGALDEHHAALLPGRTERRHHGIGIEADAEGRRRIVLEQAARHRPAGHRSRARP